MGMQLIETIEVGSGGAASIEFTSIPQDGVDLLLLLSSRGDNGEQAFFTTINNSTGTVYPQIYLAHNNTSVDTASRDDNGFFFNWHNDSTTTANTFSNSAILFSNYTSSSNKSISIDTVTENNAARAFLFLQAVTYESASPITSVKFELQLSGNFVQYTTASLYKITAD